MFGNLSRKKNMSSDIATIRVFHGTSSNTLVRFWAKDELVMAKMMYPYCDTDDLAEALKELYPCVSEKDLIDHDTQYGYRDVYIHNKTLLTLFGK